MKLKEYNRAVEHENIIKARKAKAVDRRALAKQQQALAKRIDKAIGEVKMSPFTAPLPRLSESRKKFYAMRDESKRLEKEARRNARAIERKERRRQEADELALAGGQIGAALRHDDGGRVGRVCRGQTLALTLATKINEP